MPWLGTGLLTRFVIIGFMLAHFYMENALIYNWLQFRKEVVPASQNAYACIPFQYIGSILTVNEWTCQNTSQQNSRTNTQIKWEVNCYRCCSIHYLLYTWHHLRLVSIKWFIWKLTKKKLYFFRYGNGSEAWFTIQSCYWLCSIDSQVNNIHKLIIDWFGTKQKLFNRIGNKVIKRVLSPWLWNSFIYYNLTPTGREDRRDLNIVHNFTMNVSFYHVYSCSIDWIGSNVGYQKPKEWSNSTKWQETIFNYWN